MGDELAACVWRGMMRKRVERDAVLTWHSDSLLAGIWVTGLSVWVKKLLLGAQI